MDGQAPLTRRVGACTRPAVPRRAHRGCRPGCRLRSTDADRPWGRPLPRGRRHHRRGAGRRTRRGAQRSPPRQGRLGTRELRKAVDSTVRGFTDVVAELSRAIASSERWIEGTFFRRARLEGNAVGYGSICAARRARHDHALDGQRRPGAPGDLLLLDAGVETHSLYTADVTRTLPVSGTFTPLQREIYDAVYEAQEAGIAAVKPGARYRDFHEAAQRHLTARLVEWGFIEGPVDRAYELGLQRRFTMAGTGHMLGLDVHDCAQARTEDYVDGVLEPGMCLTVEPGLHFQADDLTVPEEWRGIGVRIEDDLVVTDDGHENLSAALPRAADEVEAWMARFSG
ncbi:M24B family metallopeptidase [Streptomyces sp. INA 01156]